MSNHAMPTATPSIPSRAVALPVDEVILLEDRAHVIRRGVVEVPAGTSRLVVAEVAPVLADRTLCAAIRRAEGGPSPEGTRVQDLRIRRRKVVRTDDLPEVRRAIERDLRDLADRKRVLEGRRRRDEQALAELSERAGLALADVGVDAAWGRVDRAGWEATLAALAEEEAALRGQRLALDEALRDLEAESERLTHRLQLQQGSAREDVSGEIVVEVVAGTAGRYALQVDYLVPGACWRPYHRATLREREGAAAELHFACEGCVWQNTGEDWEDAQLIFSTERPSLGAEPPRLASEVLLVQRRAEVVQVEVREQEIQTTGLGGKARQAAKVPGIDDGGEALTLRSRTRARVPSDGRPYRVPLFEFTAAAAAEHVLMAELEPAVILKSSQENGARQPILAGPVDLVRRGGFVGRTSVLFIAPGERFALGWGPDAALRVIRTVDRAQEEKAMLSSWISTEHKVQVRISNLGAERRAIKVSERVPVSEIDKVKVEVDVHKTSERRLPDNDGLCHWNVDMQPFERRTLELRYVLRKHSDVSGI